ncbi:MAG: hypothetical protein OEL20_14295 [Sulfuritalea sp.]|nr:hypothetical protein [Sulfuritalea sp.]
MIALASWLLAASAAIILLLGLAHLVITFHGPKLHPRDAALQAEMKKVSPVVTRQTTMWKAWIGFNASHSSGAILFGLVYGYLALAHGSLLFQSPFLLLVGLAALAGYVFLARVFWFSIPYRGISLATALYVAALVVISVQR